MPTNVDKALYPAPAMAVGIDVPDDAGIEIEIKIDGEDEIEQPEPPMPLDFSANLAEELEDNKIESVASELLDAIDNDKNARKDWERAYVDGLKLLGLQYEERTEPWNGACGVFHPMITEAVVRFQAETITETFPAQGPVRTRIIGRETPEKKAAAVRVEEDMNFKLTEEMPEFRPEHERMLWSLPATGSAFKKIYYDPSLGRQLSIFIPAEDILLPYGTSDLNTCHRVTHRMRKTANEIHKLQQAGFYRDVDIGSPSRTTDDIQKAKDEETGFRDLNDERYDLYECHADLDLGEDENGIALPYVVTLIKSSGTVLAIRRNWNEDDPLRLKRQHFVHYQYIPGFGAYGFGLFHLIGGFAKSATALMRQLVDAGTLANLPGGLKSRGLRIKGDDTPIAPGEFRDVDVASGAIRDNILPLPYKEPSNTLYNLLNTIVEEGRRFASSADMKVSDMSAQAPVGSTLAILERELKVLTAVQARVHFTLKQELRLLAAIIRDYTEDSYDYEPELGEPKAKKSDYDHVDVFPVSDPNAATMSQRVVQYQAVIQMAQMAPQIYDLPQLHRRMLEVLGIKHADKIVPLPEDMKPTDPVSENAKVLKAEPVKAFADQNHEAHIQVHMGMVQDPQIAQMMGQNPQAQQLLASMMAHINEHIGFMYRRKIEERLGMALPPDEEKMPPEVAFNLAQMMAQASQQVLQASQQQAAQQQAQQQAQDPLVQIQMKQVEIQEREVAIKEKKLALDAALAADKLELEEARSNEQLRLEGMKLAIQSGKDKEAIESADRKEGMRMAIDTSKAKAQMGLDMMREMIKAEKPQTTPKGTE